MNMIFNWQSGPGLWQLAGQIVRLAIELGLHNDSVDPRISKEDIELHKRLWGIGLVIDREISLLLGRPLGITLNVSPNALANAHGTSEHSVMFCHLTIIEADIVTSLYTPTHHSPGEILMHASSIGRSLSDLQCRLATPPLSMASGMECVTLAKTHIIGMLFWRHLFNCQSLTFEQRQKTLRRGRFQLLVINFRVLTMR